jgi:ADP-ribosylglycohydrolase
MILVNNVHILITHLLQEMTLALARSLIECRGINAAHCAKTYAYFYSVPPKRGYGPKVAKILSLLASNTIDYKTSATYFYSEGSFANGGVMRIAPLAIAFRYLSFCIYTSYHIEMQVMNNSLLQ